MKQKKKLTWEERHPNGDVSHHTFFENFEDFPSLTEVETKVVLRIMKSHLEERMGCEITDELFTSIIKRIPYLAPARPFGAFSTLHGFILPLRDILKAHNYLDNNWRENVGTIMKFFGVGVSGFSIQSSVDMNL